MTSSLPFTISVGWVMLFSSRKALTVHLPPRLACHELCPHRLWATGFVDINLALMPSFSEGTAHPQCSDMPPTAKDSSLSQQMPKESVKFATDGAAWCAVIAPRRSDSAHLHRPWRANSSPRRDWDSRVALRVILGSPSTSARGAELLQGIDRPIPRATQSASRSAFSLGLAQPLDPSDRPHQGSAKKAPSTWASACGWSSGIWWPDAGILTSRSRSASG